MKLNVLWIAGCVLFLFSFVVLTWLGSAVTCILL